MFKTENNIKRGVAWSVISSFLHRTIYGNNVNFASCYSFEAEFHCRGSYDNFYSSQLTPNYIYHLVRYFLTDYENDMSFSQLISATNLKKYYIELINLYKQDKINYLPSSIIEAYSIYDFHIPDNYNNLDNYPLVIVVIVDYLLMCKREQILTRQRVKKQKEKMKSNDRSDSSLNGMENVRMEDVGIEDKSDYYKHIEYIDKLLEMINLTHNNGGVDYICITFFLRNMLTNVDITPFINTKLEKIVKNKIKYKNDIQIYNDKLKDYTNFKNKTSKINKTEKHMFVSTTNFILPHQRAEQYHLMFSRKRKNYKLQIVGMEVFDAYMIFLDIINDGSDSIYYAFNLSTFLSGDNEVISFLVGSLYMKSGSELNPQTGQLEFQYLDCLKTF